jgi:hypothetical protein
MGWKIPEHLNPELNFRTEVGLVLYSVSKLITFPLDNVYGFLQRDWRTWKMRLRQLRLK